MSPKGDADRERLWPALRALVTAALGPPDGFPDALATFVAAWVEAVPQGKPDPARQIAEFMYLHLAPNDGIYIRHSVRQDFWQEALGRRSRVFLVPAPSAAAALPNAQQYLSHGLTGSPL